MLLTLWPIAWLVLLVSVSRRAAAEDDPTFKNTVYLIRNAETNTDKAGSGLNTTGVLRSECLVNVCVYTFHIFQEHDALTLVVGLWAWHESHGRLYHR